jgi:hypothetical protein
MMKFGFAGGGDRRDYDESDCAQSLEEVAAVRFLATLRTERPGSSDRGPSHGRRVEDGNESFLVLVAAPKHIQTLPMLHHMAP